MSEPAAERREGSAAVVFVTFRVADRRYALAANDVVEVIRVPAMARVPQSPPALLGIANLRGSALPVASLRGLLGLEEQVLQPGARAIVLATGSPVAIVVDAMEDLVTVGADDIHRDQAELAAEPGELLNGSFQSGDEHRVAKILDMPRLLEAAFAHRARAERSVRRPSESRTPANTSDVAVETKMLVTFEVAGQEFALELQDVEEILPAAQATTAVPRAEALVLGMTSVRGSLLPLLSLRALLGFPPAPQADGREKVVVMKVGGATVGLVADRARAIVAAEADLIDPVPAALASRLKGESQIRGIYRGDHGRRLISIISAEHLFREDVMQRLNSRGEEAAPAEIREGDDAELTFLVFRLAGDEFALPIDTVDEVAQVPEQITQVPKAPRFLEGVVNLRGAVLPVIDQRRRFDMPRSEQAKSSRRLVVVRSGRHRAGLIVDGISDVMRVSATAVEPAPELTEGIARLVSGVINLERAARIVLVLDPLELLTQAERRLLDGFQPEPEKASA